MLNIPTPLLGEVSALTITSPGLEQSLNYYQRLGFSEVIRFDFPFPWIQVSDGALLIMLRKGNDPYIAITYYVKDMEKSAKAVENAGIQFIEKPKANDIVKRYIFQSPDALTVSLVNIQDGFNQPPGPTMLTMNQQDYFNPERYVNKKAGMFGELAHPVKDLDASISFWQKLGFVVLHTNQMPYRWAILSDGLHILGLHETTNFSYPAITFFAADMKEKIEQLKNEGLENYTEKGPGNIVLSTPEQQHINLWFLYTILIY
jgi:catechol 2,3-dioxygenase-like lactoylglutathione lyase family enzyme